MSKKHPTKMRVIEPIILFIVIAVAIFYGVNALNTGDLLWFQSKAVNIEPIRMVVVNAGEKETIIPGHEKFNSLAEAAQTSLSTPNNTALINLGLSDDSLAYFENEGVLLELYFSRPVQYHTNYRAGEPTQLLVPIEGRHAGQGYFFRGADGEWWFGAMRMGDPAPLLNVMAELGYPVDQITTVTN